MSNIIDQADCELDIPANYKNKAKRFYNDFLSITVNAIQSETANFLNSLKKYVECDPTTKLGIDWSAFKVTTLHPEVTEYMATSTNIRETMIKFFIEAKAS